MTSRKTQARSKSASDLAHLVEPIDPHSVAPELRNTPGFVARLLDPDLFRSNRTRQPSRRNQQSLSPISTRSNYHNVRSKHLSPLSPMETLANTALTTNPTYDSVQRARRVSQSYSKPANTRTYGSSTAQQQSIQGHLNGHAQVGGEHGRPSKRARSEATRSPLQQQSRMRPTTSHDVGDQPGQATPQSAMLGHRARQPSQDELDIGSFLQELANRRRSDFTPQSHPQNSQAQLEIPLAHSQSGEQDKTGTDGKGQDTNTVSEGSEGITGNSSTKPSGASSSRSSNESLIIHHTERRSSGNEGAIQTQTPPDDRGPDPPNDPVVVEAMEDVQATASMGPPSRRASKAAEQVKDSKVVKPNINGRRRARSSDLLTPANGAYQLESPQSMPNDDSAITVLHGDDSALADARNITTATNSIEPTAPGTLSRPTSAPGPSKNVTKFVGRARRASSPPRERQPMLDTPHTSGAFKVDTRTPRPKRMRKTTTCAACQYSSNSTTSEIQQWIQCNGCKRWFHFVCVGLKSERDIRSIDKFHCLDCRNEFGPTTYVRKSKRTHVSVDYAKLTEGVVQTGDDTLEHHFVQAIKAGEIPLKKENFARMRPEEVTAEYFAKCRHLIEPIVIPACWNPKPQAVGYDTSTEQQLTEFNQEVRLESSSNEVSWDAFSSELQNEADGLIKDEEGATMLATANLSSGDHENSDLIDEDAEPLHSETHAVDLSALQASKDRRVERVQDLGQDRLDMVIPRGLTVKHVAELYGPHERLPVIEVKTQQVSDQPWTVERWAEYYDDPSPDKTVRNVISLEVSRSPLGRLLRRPRVVRDLDLADSVWPQEEGPGPKVGFYVLMSVKDSYTDFHIDFGGSSVYYHIVKGKKTFFFIPPKPKYLKIYEEWNKSAAQNYIWLGNETKECYRVDLSAGDTMIIPAGWIHSVWTPENSLVVGGNFLTRLHYSTQFKIVEIEKATNVAPKYRFPSFQKVMWYTLLKYLEEDPLPEAVEINFLEGNQFLRSRPIYEEYNKFGHNSDPGPENYNARYYARAELDGLPELVSFIFRTVMIQLGRVDGITVEKQNAVIRSIPKNSGNPLENARKFAMWVAWKRGNEDVPQWAHPDGVLPDRPDGNDKMKKLSAAALKKLEKAKAIESYVPVHVAQDDLDEALPESPNGWANNHYASPKNSVLGPKRSACDACRKRRVACKHKMEVRDASMVNGLRQFEFVGSNKASLHGQALATNAPMTVYTEDQQLLPQPMPLPEPVPVPVAVPEAAPHMPETSPVPTPSHQSIHLVATPTVDIITAPSRHVPIANGMAAVHGIHTPLPRETRNKACAQCRKSKRRCLHDENGQLDPSKLADATKRPPQSKKRSSTSNGDLSIKRIKREVPDLMDFPAVAQAPIANMMSSRPSAFNEPTIPAAQIAMLEDFTAGTAIHNGQPQDIIQPDMAAHWDIDPALMEQDSAFDGASLEAPYHLDTTNSANSQHAEHMAMPPSDGVPPTSEAGPPFDPDLESSAMAAMHAVQSYDDTPGGQEDDYARLLAGQEFGLRQRT